MFSTYDLARERARSRELSAQRASLARAFRVSQRADRKARRAQLRASRAAAVLRSLPL